METTEYIDPTQESIAVSEEIRRNPESAAALVYNILQRERAIQARMTRYEFLLNQFAHEAGCKRGREEDEFVFYERVTREIGALRHERFVSRGVQRTEAGALAFKLWTEEQNRLAEEGDSDDWC